MFLLLPSSDQDDFLPVMLVIAVVFKFLEVLYVIRHQSNVDVFFVDWERPRGAKTTPSTPSPSGTDSVSIWRTYFVANEWNELQTRRRTHLAFGLFVVLALLLCTKVGDVASSDPHDIEDFKVLCVVCSRLCS